MNKNSFFKLPIILTLSYWLMGLIYSIVMKIVSGNDINNLAESIFYNLLYTFYYNTPKYLLLLFISTLALNKCKVNIVTEKNILLMIVLALILSVIVHLFSMFVASPLVSLIFNNDYGYYYDQHLYFMFYRISITFIYYLIIGCISYFGILSLQDVFERDLDSVAITKENSAKLHLFLFIILFSIVLLSLLIPILSYYSYNIFYYDYGWGQLIVYVISIILSVIILYFMIRKMFSCPFATIQTGRLIKSTIFSTIYFVLFNGIVGTALFFIVILIAFASRSSDSVAIFILIGGLIFQFLITCLIIRAVTKRYFSITYNKSTHNESTI